MALVPILSAAQHMDLWTICVVHYGVFSIWLIDCLFLRFNAHMHTAHINIDIFSMNE